MHPHLYETFFDIEDSYWWSVGTRRIFLEMLEDVRNPAVTRTLDVGCGTGANLLMLSKYGDAEGVDVSEDALAFCRERGLDKVKLAPAKNCLTRMARSIS